MADVIEKKFPLDCLIPKNETGVSSFLRKYPQYNGQGVTIAIFDSGVDSRATGLQTTPDGQVKVIERFDCSGSGDVDISKKVLLSPDNTITGLSGRTLKVTEQMKKDNINGNEFRVGLKNLTDLYATDIQEKIAAKLKLKHWDDPQAKAIARVSQELKAFNLANPPSSKDEEPALPMSKRLENDNLTEALEFLGNFEKEYSAVNRSYDCVVYQTASHWCAVIDVTESGDLENALHLAEYSKTHDVKAVDEFLSVSINVHIDGNVLEIVALSTSHGTHVASIAAGHQGSSELDGIAPAAKIVSLKISDNKFPIGMETGTGIIRAMIKVMELCKSGRQIHVINMSYGRYTYWSESGRIGELMMEVVNKYGVIWVCSTGNNGPALSTIATPPDIIEPVIIGVGAYVSPEMMEADYSQREKLPANTYTWTSRDPCRDGGQGVTICAPGGAIASVPEFQMCKQELKNGTSMAAPHVAGAIALMLSGLIQNNIEYSPYSVKRALWNSATKLGHVDRFAQGSGLLNVEKTFEHLMNFHNVAENKIRFSIKCGPNQTKGIYIRKMNPVAEEHSIAVTPIYLNDLEIDAKQKINFNVRLTLTASESWVQLASYLDLNYIERTFLVKVDPAGLAVGVHTASIKAYDSENVAKGTLFEVPVTVVKPHVVKVDESSATLKFETVKFKPATITRQFICVPRNATWAVLKLKSWDTSINMPAKYTVHTVQIRPRNKHLETSQLLVVSNEQYTIHGFKCEADGIVEVCIAKFWSNIGESDVEANLEFKGVNVNGADTMHSANGIHRIDLVALTTAQILPEIELKSAVMVLKPFESKILPLSDRDVIPPQRQIYENLLSFNFSLSKAEEVSFCLPLFHNVLYESEFDSQLWMIFDANKMMVGCGDFLTKTRYVKLKKGDYVIRAQIRHEKQCHLEKVSEAVFLANIKLEKPIQLDVFYSYKEAVLRGKKIESCKIVSDTVKPLFVAPLAQEKIAKAFPSDCSWLEGSFRYSKGELCREVDSSPFKYILTEGPVAKKPDATKNDKETDKLEEYSEGLRDYQNSMIAKLDKKQAEPIYKKLIEMHPAFLDAHVSMIQKLKSPDLKDHLPFTYCLNLLKLNDSDKAKVELNRILDLSNIVISETDSNALLAFYGLKVDSRTDATKIKKNIDKQKAALLEAYVWKAVALSKLDLIKRNLNEDVDLTELQTALDSIYEEVGKFIEYTDPKVLSITIWHSYAHSQYGRMANALHKLYADKLAKDLLAELKHVAYKLNWTHVADAVDNLIITANPPDYKLF